MLNSSFASARIIHKLSPVGYITWELENIHTGLIETGQSNNIIVNNGRIGMADLMTGGAPSLPNYIGVGTGTNTPASGDTALQTLSQYDGVNDNKIVFSRFIVQTYKARFTTQFTSTEANITIREIGLFDAANSAVMWARVVVNITKTSSHRLTVLWHITFERDTDVALKAGTSIAATGTLTSVTDSTLTFASKVTLLRIENNTSDIVYAKLNGSMTGTPPTGYDFIIPSGGSIELMNEEIEIATTDSVHVYKVSAGNITLPDNEFSCVGW